MKFRRVLYRIVLPFVALGSIISGFSGCSNDIDVTANWKETMIVYCLLDTKADTQFVRLGKAFLNEKTGALQIAKIADSIYPDTAIVTIKDLTTGKKTTLKRYNAPKNMGLFSDARNPVYIMVRQQGDSILYQHSYELEILNPKTHYKITSQTNVVEPARLTSPFRNANAVFSFSIPNIVFDFFTGSNAAGADGKLLVNYTEMLKSDTNVKVQKTIAWNLFTSKTVNATENVTIPYPQRSFFFFLRNVMGVDDTKIRRINSLGSELYTGNQMVMDYISINEPSIGIVQKQAEYSNINGGYGLFASRCAQIVNNVRFEPQSIQTLQTDSITRALNIIR